MTDLIRELFERKPGIGDDAERNGSIFHYHLPEGREIVVYPLLFGEAVLCTGRIDRDSWEHGYYFRTRQAAVDAAMAWTDTTEAPPGDWYKKRDGR